MTLEGLLEIDTSYQLPSIKDVFEDIKQMVFASLKKLVGNFILVTLMSGFMPNNMYAAMEMTSLPVVEIVVDNYGNQPEIKAAAVVYPNHFRMYKRIDDLKSLDENWDNAGGLKISWKAISLAGRVIDSLSEDVLAHCSLFPAADSGVYIQGRFAKGTLIMAVSDETITYVLKGEGIDRLSAKSLPFSRKTIQKMENVITENLIR